MRTKAASVRAMWVPFIHTDTNSALTGLAYARTAAAAVGVEAFFVQTEATFVCVEVPLVRASWLFVFLGEPIEDGNIESHRAVENGAAKLRSLGRGVVRHYQSLFSRTSPYLRDIVFCSFACLVGPTVSVWMATPRRIC